MRQGARPSLAAVTYVAPITKAGYRMQEELFDRASDYDEMLQRGLRLSGEDKGYFIEGRLSRLAHFLPAGFTATRILDFGCGTGDTTRQLVRHFPGASVVGADVSAGA